MSCPIHYFSCASNGVLLTMHCSGCFSIPYVSANHGDMRDTETRPYFCFRSSVCGVVCSGVYYWQNGSRNDKAQVRLETSDDDTTTEIFITGVRRMPKRHTKYIQISSIKGLI